MFLRWRARRRACTAAKNAALLLLPGEPTYSVVVCADEPDRFVVRVFCGKNATDLPPAEIVRPMLGWRVCLVFAVAKDTEQVEPLSDDRYHPKFR